MAKLTQISAGFIPLTDCMNLVVAKEMGFAESQGIELLLSREFSWANIRDRMAVGHYDVAHMLAPMPIAFNTNLAPFSVPVIAPMALGLGGNAVTASNGLWRELENNGAQANGDPVINGKALAKAMASRQQAGANKIKFGVVHPHSGHNLELRYWLSASGIKPDTDVEILVVPPPLMPDALASGRIDGYCVGEPWNSVAVARGDGHIVTTKSAIWKSSPEKVLGVRTEWADTNTEALTQLLIALHRSAQWCSEADNRNQLASILSQPDYVNVPGEVIRRALCGELDMGNGTTQRFEDFLVPFERAATFPWQSHALWFYSQMVRWGQIEHTQQNFEIAKNSFRPDLYRQALAEIDAVIPAANMKVEGALRTATAVGSTGRLMLGPDGFFDDKTFDPEKLDAYLLQG